jgi:fused signal recognition particle receptor
MTDNATPSELEPEVKKKGLFARFKESFVGSEEDQAALAAAEGFIDDAEIAPWQHLELSPEEQASLLVRFREGLSKTGAQLGEGMAN